MNIAPTTQASYTPSGASSTISKSGLDMHTFLQLLTVQLATQNPLEPMSDRDFFAQLAQLGTVQGIDKLRESMDVAQASQIMGKTIVAVRPFTDTGTGANEIVTGVVKRLTVRNGEYFLGVQEANGGMVEVRMSNIQSIAMTEARTTGTGTPE
ncbi:MAG TPA: flagellar hook capping FlgD N-terminal domain-containing protein [Fimbriimonadaceae bacterium]|nr:flagellar hook capping FlgD N-terminal domain-containing protein [Fimbriimonadaceae bacterium]